MQEVNLVVVLNQAADKVLLCRRRKDPYKGLSNFVGGKVEPGEDRDEAAYRELWEETGISAADIRLVRLMDFTYWPDDCLLEVYAGQLNKEVVPAGDENELYWSELDCDFFDSTQYAGEGNMGHIMEHVRYSWDKIRAADCG